MTDREIGRRRIAAGEARCAVLRRRYQAEIEDAHGEILRCEPPRLLAVTWVYGDRPADEVALRLSPHADGGTVLELEHASVCDTAPDGVSDAVLGVGVGWEPALYALDLHLRGELPDTLAPDVGAGEPSPELVELMDRSGGPGPPWWRRPARTDGDDAGRGGHDHDATACGPVG